MNTTRVLFSTDAKSEAARWLAQWLKTRHGGTVRIEPTEALTPKVQPSLEEQLAVTITRGARGDGTIAVIVGNNWDADDIRMIAHVLRPKNPEQHVVFVARKQPSSSNEPLATLAALIDMAWEHPWLRVCYGANDQLGGINLLKLATMCDMVFTYKTDAA